MKRNKKEEKIKLGIKFGNNTKCQSCGKDFYTFPSETIKYCSKECVKHKIGYTQSIEWINKRVESTGDKLLGKIPPNKGKKTGKFVNCKYCNKEIYKMPSSIKENNFCNRKCSNDYFKGENSPNWKGGYIDNSGKHKYIRENSSKYKKWRKYVLDRDDNKCKLCGSKDRLEIHHIIPFSQCPELAVLKMNGVTLCHECHKKTDSYGKNNKQEQSIGKSFSLMFTIPHNLQAYPTVGNYEWTEDKTLVIFVSETGNEDYNFMIFIHELVEAYICERRGIKEEDITKFDLMFEAERDKGLWTDEEPGFDPRCNYLSEHTLATNIEKKLASELNINWDKYDGDINSLS